MNGFTSADDLRRCGSRGGVGIQVVKKINKVYARRQSSLWKLRISLLISSSKLFIIIDSSWILKYTNYSYNQSTR